MRTGVRIPSVAVVTAVLLMACGGGDLTAAEYAEAAEDVVGDMEARFRAIDTEWETGAPTKERALEYWDRRLEIRGDVLERIRELDPPPEVDEMHDSAVTVFEKIAAADEALAARVGEYQAVTEHWQWADTPEGRAADAVLEEVFAFCRASQEAFDATQHRESLGEEVPWLPPEMAEVIRVAFGCPPQP